MGIFFPWRAIGLYAPSAATAPTDAIYFHEALAVCAAIHRVRHWTQAGRRIRRLAILSDNTNTVSAFNSLRTPPVYNSILKSAVDIMIRHSLQVRVDHVPGALNVVADALSRGNLALVRELVPGIALFPFSPPRDALGASLS
ncbi:hypothetical protein OH77DRAFT_1409750 [Trametes cingulata]|nr:hypothetical protein OH77DRAFT_1409750 [Trametes cingulata]